MELLRWTIEIEQVKRLFVTIVYIIYVVGIIGELP